MAALSIVRINCSCNIIAIVPGQRDLNIGVGAQSTLEEGQDIFARECMKNEQNARMLHDKPNCQKKFFSRFL